MENVKNMMVEINKDEIVQEEMSNICRILDKCETYNRCIIECIEENDLTEDIYSYIKDMCYTVHNLPLALCGLEERLDEIRERAVVNGEQQ